MSIDDYARLPERRAHRRVVFVMDQADIEWMEADSSGRDLRLREDAAVLYFGTDLEAADPVTQRLDRQGLLVPGAVLLASPYRNDEYSPLDVANDRFTLEKWASVSTLCAYLGARSLSVRSVEDTRSRSKWEATAGGGFKLVEATAKAKGLTSDVFVAQLEWDDSYLGGKANLELAREYLVQSGLEGDPEIRSLVEARSHPGNLLARRSLVVDVGRESERALEAALAIKPPALAGFEAAFNRARESQAHYRLTLDIDFGES